LIYIHLEPYNSSLYDKIHKIKLFMGLKESSQLFINHSENSFYWSAIGSYAYSFLPLVFPSKEKFKHILNLACGYGGDLVAARIFFGDSVKLTGVDINDLRLSNNGKYEFEQNMNAAGADFLLADMRNINKIIERNQDTDLILIRHPARMKTEEEFISAREMMSPWMDYSLEKNIPLVFSVFGWDMDGRNKLAQIARDQGNSVRLIDNPRNNYTFYNLNTTTLFVPDAYGFIMNE